MLRPSRRAIWLASVTRLQNESINKHLQKIVLCYLFLIDAICNIFICFSKAQGKKKILGGNRCIIVHGFSRFVKRFPSHFSFPENGLICLYQNLLWIANSNKLQLGNSSHILFALIAINKYLHLNYKNKLKANNKIGNVLEIYIFCLKRLVFTLFAYFGVSLILFLVNENLHSSE